MLMQQGTAVDAYQRFCKQLPICCIRLLRRGTGSRPKRQVGICRNDLAKAASGILTTVGLIICEALEHAASVAPPSVQSAIVRVQIVLIALKMKRLIARNHPWRCRVNPVVLEDSVAALKNGVVQNCRNSSWRIPVDGVAFHHQPIEFSVIPCM